MEALEHNNKKRIVVTGIGVHTSIGANRQEVTSALKAGKCGIGQVPESRFETAHGQYASQKAHLLPEDVFLDLQEKDPSVVTELSIQVVGEALKDAQLDLDSIDKMDIGLSLAISTGTSFPFIKWLKKKIDGTLRKEDLELVLKSTQSITADVSKAYGFEGPNTTLSTACASGTISIGTAYDKLQMDDCKYMVAGGVDLITILSYSGFNSLKNVSSDVCMPFDENRDGLVLGEGAGYVVLETLENAQARGAKIYAEVSGYSYINEAYHPTSPHPEGEYAYYCMNKALTNSGKSLAQVNYINAHGTSTSINDTMEVKAIERLVGDNEVFVSSTKSMTGHTLGAAGSIEFIFTCLAIKEAFVPPTVNTTNPIVSANSTLSFPSEAVDYQIDVAISNSFGFGGNTACIVVNKV